MPTNTLQRMALEIAQAPDGSSLYVDITLPGYEARATVERLGGGRGYCDTEILDTETEEPIHWQHREFGSSTELASALTSFFGKLRGLPSSASASTFPFALPLAHTSVSLDALLEPLPAVAGH